MSAHVSYSLNSFKGLLQAKMEGSIVGAAERNTPLDYSSCSTTRVRRVAAGNQLSLSIRTMIILK